MHQNHQNVQKHQKVDLSNPTYKKVGLLMDEWLGVQYPDQEFTAQDIWGYLGLGYDDRQPKLYVSQQLWYRAKKQDPPTLKQRGKRFRIIDREADIIRWKEASPENFFDIILPFDLHKFVRLHRKSIMVVGGVSNEGKTTLAHSVINLNWQRHQIALFDSENSDEELANRFSHYPDYELWPDDFVKDRSANFSDIIEPDAINIIDYLEVQDNFWLVGKYIREIRDALRNGIAIIVLQKGEGSKLPIGRDFSRHLARCVITIDKGILTIIKAKDRAQKTINPINKKWTFRIDETGTQFLDIKEWQGGG